MLRTLTIVLALTSVTTLAYAQSAAIGQRKEILKGWGTLAKEPGDMLKGDAKFDLAKVQALLTSLKEGAPKLKALFPADSKTGETRALPAIWEKNADFLGRFDKIAADATAAAAAIKDEASFKTELPKIFGNCGGCHREYRSPQ